MGQIKINVTEEDILNGKQGNIHGCAIALAIERELAKRSETPVIEVGGCIRVDGKTYKLPKKGQQFVGKFDHNRKSAKPFSFMLREDKAIVPRISTPSYMVMPAFHDGVQFSYFTAISNNTSIINF